MLNSFGFTIFILVTMLGGGISSFSENKPHEANQEGERIEACAKVGEQYSNIYKDEYPTTCCAGLQEWERGMDTRKVIDGVCVTTEMISGNPIGVCLACGDGKCDQKIETVCNCPEDCKNPNESAKTTSCAQAGENYVSVGQDYPMPCCAGLKAWPSCASVTMTMQEGQCFFDPRIVADCGPIGTCLACGDGVCDAKLEDLCSCPADCK